MGSFFANHELILGVTGKDIADNVIQALIKDDIPIQMFYQFKQMGVGKFKGCLKELQKVYPHCPILAAVWLMMDVIF